MRKLGRSVGRSVILVLLASVFVCPLAAQQVDPDVFGALRYRHLGPEGNRADVAVGEPGEPSIAYVGAASGGIWRTLDGGLNWEPVFDDTGVSSVNALAVAPSAPNEVWAGTGETFIIREGLSIGNGVWKSTDRGESWEHVGLERTGRISEIVVHPTNPDLVYACALGSGYEPQPERGIFRTTDGGGTWEKVLFVDENTGCSDLALDPNDPRTLVAGMWQLSIKTWNLESGGPGSGVFVSRDSGDTWARIGGAVLPTEPVGKISVDIARTTSRMYALIEEDVSPALYRSDDRGESWTLVSRDQKMTDRSFYYTQITVAPDDEDRVYFQSIQLQMSVDGGETLVVDPPGRGLFDTHKMWIDPTDPDRMLVSDDGGAGITLNGGRTWERVRLPIAQLYHVYADNEVPYYVYANRQDGPSYRGPSNSKTGGGITLSEWHSVGGGESGFGIPDTTTNRIVWSGSFDGVLQRFDLETMQARSVRVWPETEDGWSPADIKYRWNWTFPIALSPHDPEIVYVGSQHVHETSNGGQTWREMSPDLTLDDEPRQVKSGGMTYDIIGTFIWGTLWSIAESPVEQGVIWTGSNDGLVHVTRDGGGNWDNVTENIEDLPPEGKISIVEPSHFDVATAYVAVDRHMFGDYAPYIYKTTDYGGSWSRIDGGIPRSIFSYIHVVREDPERPGVLYAGTENGVYVSLDDGAHWVSLQLNLPPAPVYWLTVQPHFNDLVVGTYGRGIWILDDVGSIRDLAPDILASGVHLFTPRPAYRFHSVASRPSDENSNIVGENPPYGANLDYYLAESQAAEDVSLTILDDGGRTVRTMQGTSTPGINRVWWDLRYPAPRSVVLRSRPPDRPWVTLDQDGTRPLTARHVIRSGPLAPPGAYTVVLKVGDREWRETLDVRKDPISAGTERDIRAQVELAQDITAAADTVVTMINRLEWIRHQLDDLKALARSGAVSDEVALGVEDLEARTLAVEGNLINIYLADGLRDFHQAETRLFEHLGFLGADVIGASLDYPPTDAQGEVFTVLRARLQLQQAEFDTYMRDDVAAFNRLLERSGLRGLISDP